MREFCPKAAINNTFTLDEASKYTLYVENNALSGLKMTITGDGYEYRHSFKGDKEFFGEIAQGELGPGTYNITLIPIGKKEASVKFVYFIQ